VYPHQAERLTEALRHRVPEPVPVTHSGGRVLNRSTPGLVLLD